MPQREKYIAAIILAAGAGNRAKEKHDDTLPKQYKKIGNRAILTHTIEVFLSSPIINHIIVVINRNDMENFYHTVGHLINKIQIVFGGITRQESCFLGLIALENISPDIVLLHDGVRPFVHEELIERTVCNVSEHSGAIPALPLTETVKRSGHKEIITETLDRDNLHAAQTPQAFPYKPLLQAHKKAKEENFKNFTDDSSLAEWAGMHIKIVPGCIHNQKLTWSSDITKADKTLNDKSFFPDVRTGNGYDVHSFEQGDHVTLCGVRIPHTKRLCGHSDADVALHALTDALLATCGAQDIGTHFPPSDMQWKNAPSSIFLEHAVKIIQKKNGRIANTDITLICESPRIASYRNDMITNLKKILNITEDRISIKATTNEKLGFIGREEGIAAIATASVVFPGNLL